MSATLTKLYKEYFDVPTEPIHVGVRTFPITEYFVEDLNQFKFPKKEANAAHAITEECQKKRCNSAPSPTELTKRCSLAAHLAKAVGRPGSSVLIFVPGMNEIVSITECIEDFMSQASATHVVQFILIFRSKIKLMLSTSLVLTKSKSSSQQTPQKVP
eukprot:scaffold758_cov104-Cylindrotheca_fusiformis.AAC.9